MLIYKDYLKFVTEGFYKKWTKFTILGLKEHSRSGFICGSGLSLKLLSVKDNSGQMHLSAADYVDQNSSAHVVRCAQMHLTAVVLTETGLR